MGARTIGVGAVIFDDPDMPGMGWACRAGGDPFRIPGVQALASDSLWIVNATFDEMNVAGLAQHAFFRGANFLRLSVEAILGEMGMLAEDGHVAEPDQAARVIADLFERQVRMLCLLTGTPRERWKPPRSILRSAVRSHLMAPDDRLGDTLLDAVNESNQAFTRCRSSGRGGGTKTALGFLPVPRLEHARAVLDCPVPANSKWEPVEPPNALADVSEWLKRNAAPMLIRATVENFEPSIGQLINFGGVANVNQRQSQGRVYHEASTRQWITSDEARMFSHFADLTIHEAVAFPQWTQVSKAIPQVRQFFERVDPLDHLSYSVGLFAENLWTGLTLNLEAHPTDRGLAANVIAPFLRSADRLNCLQYAIDVTSQDYEVMSFGVGRVGVFLREGPAGMTDEALRVAATAGLVPHFPRAGVGAMPVPPILSDSEVYRSQVEMIASDMRDTLLEVDQEVVDAYTRVLSPAAAVN